LAGKDPTELGILDEEADEDAIEGAGADGRKRGRGGDQDGGQNDSGDPDGSERERGNASSGTDDDGNPVRGNAQLSDDSQGGGAGHHRVPPLSEQAHAALSLIKQDQREDNRATTYSWDVTFYRPGIYGPGQKAQELVHLVVDKAAPFDPVWQKAQINIASLVKRGDAGAEPPSLDDLMAALRLARARGEGEPSAVTRRLRVQKPMGRA
jgi:hypothetical protein